MLNAQRKRELKKKYPNGKAVGKAFIQNYLERKKPIYSRIFRRF